MRFCMVLYGLQQSFCFLVSCVFSHPRQAAFEFILQGTRVQTQRGCDPVCAHGGQRAAFTTPFLRHFPTCRFEVGSLIVLDLTNQLVRLSRKPQTFSCLCLCPGITREHPSPLLL